MDTEDRVINRRSEEAPVSNCKDCPDRERVDLTHKADNIITALNTLVSEVLKGKAIVTSNMTNFQVTLQEIDSELTKFDFSRENLFQFCKHGSTGSSPSRT